MVAAKRFFVPITFTIVIFVDYVYAPGEFES